MIKGTTSTGFAFEVVGDIMDDFEFVDDVAELNNGNILVAPALIKRMLGDEGKKALYEHCRNEKGIVSIEAVANELTEILETENDELKK